MLASESPASLTLSRLRDQYVNGYLTRKEFEERLVKTLYDNYQQFNLFKRDREIFIDYIGWLFPRLRKAIDAYQDMGSSFDAYICSYIRCSAKEFRLNESKPFVIEQACWEALAEAPEEDDLATWLEAPEALKPVKNPQQMLILLLKFYYLISEEMVWSAAPALEISAKRLIGMLDNLGKLRLNKDDRFRKQEERMYSAFYWYMVYGKQLESLPEDSLYRKTLEQYAEKTWMRYQCFKQQLSRIKRQASNRQVAEVFDIPKGTVDATMSAIKRKFKA